jgi:D-glycero-D-manno-heptose 1,7-bisphosphate phosphatase
MSGIPAMFLDRDGVIIENAHYLARLSDIRLIPGAAEAIRRLNIAGIPVVVVSNQSGVARGYFPESFVRETHAYLDDLLARQGARVDCWCFCPHHPEFGLDCPCRKPKPGMLLAAARERTLDLSQSWLIGDNVTDLQAGASAGCRTILVRTGHGATMQLADDWTCLNLQAVVDALPDAVEHFFQHLEMQRAA